MDRVLLQEMHGGYGAGLKRKLPFSLLDAVPVLEDDRPFLSPFFESILPSGKSVWEGPEPRVADQSMRGKSSCDRFEIPERWHIRGYLE